MVVDFLNVVYPKTAGMSILGRCKKEASPKLTALPLRTAALCEGMLLRIVYLATRKMSSRRSVQHKGSGKASKKAKW
nr:MAG TPA: hypothetical protein [Caudoviricetes sp.]